jgi:hypothetical protein
LTVLAAIGVLAVAVTLVRVIRSVVVRAEDARQAAVDDAFGKASSGHDLLGALVLHMTSIERGFYESSSNRNHFLMYGLAVFTLCISLANTIASGLIPDSGTIDHSMKLVLLGLSAGTAAATGISQIFRFGEREALREEGRLELDDIVLNERALLTRMQVDPEQQLKDFHAIRARFFALETSQHRRDVRLRDKVDEAEGAANEPAPNETPQQAAIVAPSNRSEA